MNNSIAARLSRPFPDLRALIRRGWEIAMRDTNIVVASVIMNNFLRAVSSAVLTRLLVPEVFGIAGLIASVLFTVSLVSDLGFQAFVVRHKDGDSPRFLDTIWTVSLIRSLSLAALVAGASTPIAALMGKPELAPLIAVSSLTLVVEGIASLSLITALRHRMILRLSLLELAVMVVQIVSTAVLAYLWRSYWAILGGLLISGMVKTVFSYVIFPNARRWLALDRGHLRDLWGFARFVTGSSIITMLLMQCDKLVLARVMPLDSFGLYILAGNLSSAPLAFTFAYASRVLYPAYAQLWRDGVEDLRAQLYAKRRLPSLLYTFAAGGLIGSAPLIVGILYDPRYSGATIYLQLLAISPLFALASCAANESLTATGRIQATFQASIAKLLWLALAGPAGYLLGGTIGLVAVVGLMEPAVVLFKWEQMRRARLLDLPQELMFLAAGGVGILVGMIGDQLVRAVVRI